MGSPFEATHGEERGVCLELLWGQKSRRDLAASFFEGALLEAVGQSTMTRVKRHCAYFAHATSDRIKRIGRDEPGFVIASLVVWTLRLVSLGLALPTAGLSGGSCGSSVGFSLQEGRSAYQVDVCIDGLKAHVTTTYLGGPSLERYDSTILGPVPRISIRTWQVDEITEVLEALKERVRSGRPPRHHWSTHPRVIVAAISLEGRLLSLRLSSEFGPREDALMEKLYKFLDRNFVRLCQERLRVRGAFFRDEDVEDRRRQLRRVGRLSEEEIDAILRRIGMIRPPFSAMLLRQESLRRRELLLKAGITR